MTARRNIVWPIAIAQTLIWAAIYYIFAPLLPQWEALYGWRKAEITGAFTMAVLLSGAMAPLIGTAIDRGHGRLVLSAGPILGGCCLFGLAFSQTLWQFYLFWAGIGFAQSASLYEPCFAVLTRLYRTDAKRAITIVTLVAGFAGSVAFPIAHNLAVHFGVAMALATFGVVAILCGLANAVTLAGTEAHYRSQQAGQPSEPAKNIATVIGSPVFWLLGIAFSMIAFNHGALLTHLLPLLAERGVETSIALLAASLIGAMQVVGRLGMMAIERRVSVYGVVSLSFLFMAIAALTLLGAGESLGLVAVFVILQGAGYGVTSITRPVVTAELMGHRGFGAVSGGLAILFMGAFAIAPTAAALGWEFAGYDLVIAVASGICLIGLASFWAAVRAAKKSLRQQPRE